MSTHPIIPFALPELSIRWARRTIRACSVLRRLVEADCAMAPVEALARAARELLDGAAKDPATCQMLTIAAWLFVDREWDSLSRDPRGKRRAVLAGYADASVAAASDWVRCALGDSVDRLDATPALAEANPTMPTIVQGRLHGAADPGPAESEPVLSDTASDVDPLRDDLHLALIQADVGELFPQLVLLADALVAAAVLAALNEPPEVPF